MGISVDLVGVVVEGVTDRFCGRPRDRNPYDPGAAMDAYVAWEWGWDEGNFQLDIRGQEEARRWLKDVA